MSDLRSSRVLVTGASGFIGSCLCRRLDALGAEVHGVSRSGGVSDDVSWHRLDAADPAALSAVVGSVAPAAVFHLASHVTASVDVSAVRPTLEGTLLSTVAVLEAAAAAGCRRVVLTGSYKELGTNGEVPASPYATAKLAATHYAKMFHDLCDVDVFNLRVFTVFGPGQKDLARLVPYAVTSLLKGEAPALTSGMHRLDWIYVEDVVDALVAAGSTDSIGDAVPIEIGSGTLLAIREFAERLSDEVGARVAPSFGAIPDRMSGPEYVARLDRAEQILGWRPTTDVATGIRRTVAWYAGHVTGAA